MLVVLESVRLFLGRGSAKRGLPATPKDIIYNYRCHLRICHAGGRGEPEGPTSVMGRWIMECSSSPEKRRKNPDFPSMYFTLVSQSLQLSVSRPDNLFLISPPLPHHFPLPVVDINKWGTSG